MLDRLTQRAAALAVAAALPAAAMAAGTHAIHIGEAMEHMPDVAIDVAELRAAGDESFAAVDLDGDGMITEAEFGERHEGGGAFTFSTGDAPMVFVQGGPSAIDLDSMTEIADIEVEVERLAGDVEARAFRLDIGDDEERFAELDSDGDGQLSLEEYKARHENGGMHQVFAAAFDGPGGSFHGSAFRGFDENEDGVITRDEWPSPESELIEMDTDGDGVVTFEELSGGERTRLIKRREVVRRP